MRNRFLIALILGVVSLAATAQTIIKSTDSHIKYSGRIAFKNGAAILSWSGNSAKINFNGTGIKASLKDEFGKNYLKVILDGTVLKDVELDSLQHSYDLVSGLASGPHTLELFKRTEWIFGRTLLYGFELEGDSKIEATPLTNTRKIEFYGNSITCGYAVLDTTGKDRGTPPYEDNYLSYAYLTAKHFNAEYSCIARSGIGVMVSWFPLIMPEMYDKLDPADEKSTWNFNKYTPDVVVINLFQNDSWLVKQPQHPEFAHRFGAKAPDEKQIIAAYQNFIKTIRKKYPQANIICALGSMDATREGSQWPGYITKAAEGLHDVKIKTHFFPYKGTAGHPSKTEQQAMADDLIKYIDKNIRW
ncbi:GDSL-type esterase/lipase family protein [Mucilaginibacter sp. RS28]|uniref:GDSL-type esterase/lipase family protein n=1 Tax=Mucilaginibacter straminoryzae TaxID=2932774 RepID=A0A9X1X1U5_9SPHI|nr:SGNH/GDSL hydrolase family protein [Mucilaginibacter straminoryzae]MCJ8209637.1 GDSL-type esterase/lipase family protein [Mucilaginibacter straminoryzae]